MRISNPVEYDSYMRKERFTTTYSATWNRKSLEFPSTEKTTLEKLNKTYSHPNSTPMDSKYMKITAQGYAKNNAPFLELKTEQEEDEEKKCRKSDIQKRQEKLDITFYGNSGYPTIYRRSYQNPEKIRR